MSRSDIIHAILAILLLINLFVTISLHRYVSALSSALRDPMTAVIVGRADSVSIRYRLVKFQQATGAKSATDPTIPISPTPGTGIARPDCGNGKLP